MSPRAKKSLLLWLALSPLVVLILFPYAVMISTAIKPGAEVMSFPPRWFGSRIELGNFVEMWREVAFGQALANSLYVSFASTLLCLVIAIPAAYAMSRYRFAGQGAYRLFLLITQMLSPIVLVIGIFRLMAALGLVDRLNSLVLTYATFNLAFSVWMLQSYFATIPKEVEEAAWIDGASWLQALTRVFLPMALPALAVTAILSFIFGWNEFVLALTNLRSSESYTLTLKVFDLVGGRYTVEWQIVMAATFTATVPVAIVFAWLQRYMVRGLALAAVK
jgi:multiple sugar transport system permease protein